MEALMLSFRLSFKGVLRSLYAVREETESLKRRLGAAAVLGFQVAVLRCLCV
jgi:hypothetical protein